MLTRQHAGLLWLISEIGFWESGGSGRAADPTAPTRPHTADAADPGDQGSTGIALGQDIVPVAVTLLHD
jgi:hypothetical protein